MEWKLLYLERTLKDLIEALKSNGCLGQEFEFLTKTAEDEEQARSFLKAFLLAGQKSIEERKAAEEDGRGVRGWFEELWYKTFNDQRIVGIVIMAAGGYLMLWGLLRFLEVFVFGT